MAGTVSWDPLNAACASLQGDDDIVALFPEDARDILREARQRYRDGHTPDPVIGEMLAPLRELPALLLN